jgi:hypothetical protein
MLVMKTSIISVKSILIALAAMALVGFTACDVDDVADPNGPSLEGVLNNASRSDLALLITGTESLMRQDLNFYYYTTGIIGRDWWYFTAADPRFTGELLGRDNSVLDPAGFYGTRPYQGRYRSVKNCNILLQAVENNASNLSLTSEEVNAFNGFAKTIQAHELLLSLNLQYQNGIRLDVSDPDNLGSFVSYDEALAGIRSLLEEASNHLSAAGSAFPFTLSPGFDGFDNPASFRQFANGMAARVALYQSDKAAARNFLTQSFIDPAGNLNAGPARYYSTGSGELNNEIYETPGTSEALVAHPDWVSEMEAGDDRISKVAPRDPITLDGLTGDHDVIVYPSLSSPIYMIRNEELVLIRAEANIGFDNNAAVSDIDAIRTAHGLAPYSGGTDDASLTNEILKQRRYSLFCEGHRWIDMRRYGRLGELAIDRTGDDVWEQLPRPVSEN